jgi:sarcosine oxidase gamma subunit
VLSPAGTPQRSFTVNGKSLDAADGRFELPLPVSGPFWLQIVAGTSPEITRQVEVPAGGAPLDLGDVKLEVGGTVVGSVVDATGKDAPKNPSLRLKGADGRDRSAMVQKDGRFEIDRVGPGSFTLVASAEGYAAAATSVKAGARGVTLKLERYASLELTVTQKGERRAKAELDLTGPPSADGSPNKRYVQVDADGVATVTQLAPGPWTVQLRGGPSQAVTLLAGQRRKLTVAAP